MSGNSFDWPFALEVAANGAAIATAIIAFAFFVQFHLSRRSKRLRLENYLKEEAAELERIRMGSSSRTVFQLMKTLGMTETEIIDASFRSKCIFRRASRGQSQELLLEYMSPKEIEEEREIERLTKTQRPSWWNVRI
jgi:hypothetical protein